MSNTRRATAVPEVEKNVIEPPTDEMFMRRAAADQERELLDQLRQARAMIIKADWIITALAGQLREAGIEPAIKMPEPVPQ